jgi:hypothetical protein
MAEVTEHPDGGPLHERLTEVVRLSTSLAYRVLNTQLIGSTVPPNQVKALVEAARLLHESGVDWPPGVTEALRRLAETITPNNPEADQLPAEKTPERDEDASSDPMSRARRVKRFIRSFRKGRG